MASQYLDMLVADGASEIYSLRDGSGTIAYAYVTATNSGTYSSCSFMTGNMYIEDRFSNTFYTLNTNSNMTAPTLYTAFNPEVTQSFAVEWWWKMTSSSLAMYNTMWSKANLAAPANRGMFLSYRTDLNSWCMRLANEYSAVLNVIEVYLTSTAVTPQDPRDSGWHHWVFNYTAVGSMTSSVTAANCAFIVDGILCPTLISPFSPAASFSGTIRNTASFNLGLFPGAAGAQPGLTFDTIAFYPNASMSLATAQKHFYFVSDWLRTGSAGGTPVLISASIDQTQLFMTFNGPVTASNPVMTGYAASVYNSSSSTIVVKTTGSAWLLPRTALSYLDMCVADGASEIFPLREGSGSILTAYVTASNSGTLSASFVTGNLYIEDRLSNTFYTSTTNASASSPNLYTAFNPEVTQSFAVEWWMRTLSGAINTNDQTVWIKQTLAPPVRGIWLRYAVINGYGWMMRIENDSLQAAYIDVTPNGKNLAFQDNMWHHWVFNFTGVASLATAVNASNCNWIIDGVQYGSTLPSFSPTSFVGTIRNTSPLYIGAPGAGGGIQWLQQEALAFYPNATMSLATAQKHYRFASDWFTSGVFVAPTFQSITETTSSIALQGNMTLNFNGPLSISGATINHAPGSPASVLSISGASSSPTSQISFSYAVSASSGGNAGNVSKTNSGVN